MARRNVTSHRLGIPQSGAHTKRQHNKPSQPTKKRTIARHTHIRRLCADTYPRLPKSRTLSGAPPNTCVSERTSRMYVSNVAKNGRAPEKGNLMRISTSTSTSQQWPAANDHEYRCTRANDYNEDSSLGLQNNLADKQNGLLRVLSGPAMPHGIHRGHTHTNVDIVMPTAARAVELVLDPLLLLFHRCA